MAASHRVLIVLVALAGIFLPLASNAQATANCPKPKVYFVNGVWNFSVIDARNGARALEKAIIENGGPSDLRIQTLFNPGDGGLEDLAEVATDQSLVGGVLNAAKFLVAMVDSTFDLPLLLVGANRSKLGFQTISGWLQDQIDSIKAKQRRVAIAAQIKATILSKIQNDKTPVVLIAHSQGNIVVSDVVSGLKTSNDTKDIPGVQAIGVVGIGVASRLGNLTSLTNNALFYKYITYSGDLIIRPLVGNPGANFIAAPTPFVSDPTGHVLIDTYLDPYKMGYFERSSSLTSTRKVVASIFNEVYQNVLLATPCITVGSSPNPSNFGDQVTFAATLTGRSQGIRFTSRNVEFKNLNGDLFCTGVVDGAGKASCTTTFSAPARTEQVIATLAPSGELPNLSSSVYVQGIQTFHWRGSWIGNGQSWCGDWTWEQPCVIAGLSHALAAYFAFEDGKSGVVIDDSNGARALRPWTWSMGSGTFGFTLGTKFSAPGIGLSEDGVRVTTFQVTSVDNSQAKGVYSITTRSGYFLGGRVSAATWRSQDTVVTGNWVAAKYPGPMPNPDMNGYDFCDSSNRGYVYGMADFQNLNALPAAVVNACTFSR